jgi:hypothetical protein
MKQESNMKLEDRRAIGETKELILVIQYSFKRKSTAGAGRLAAQRNGWAAKVRKADARQIGQNTRRDGNIMGSGGRPTHGQATTNDRDGIQRWRRWRLIRELTHAWPYAGDAER